MDMTTWSDMMSIQFVKRRVTNLVWVQNVTFLRIINVDNVQLMQNGKLFVITTARWNSYVHNDI